MYRVPVINRQSGATFHFKATHATTPAEAGAHARKAFNANQWMFGKPLDGAVAPAPTGASVARNVCPPPPARSLTPETRTGLPSVALAQEGTAQTDEPAQELSRLPRRSAAEAGRPLARPAGLSPTNTETMKISIKRIELLTAIAAVRPAARGSLPILNNLLVVAGPGNNVTLTASDLDLFIRVKTEAEVAKEGKTTVPAALLQDIARLTDTKEISLEVAKNAIKISCGSTKHQLVTIDPDDFPPFPRLKPQSNQKDAKEPVEFVLDDSVFRKALQEASFAASTEEARAILCGTLVKLDGKQMHVAGCDGRRLAAATLDSPVANKVTLVLPTKTVRELIRLLGADANKPQRLTVLAGENHASFTFASAYESEITIVSKLIDGQYPDYTKIIPPENAIATLPRAELLRCVERIALVADDVNLEFNGSALHLRSQGRRGTELLGEAQDSLLVPAKVKEKVEVTYAARFLGAALQSVDADVLEFHLDPARRLGLFKVPGRGWLSVIAPCKKGTGESSSSSSSSSSSKPAPTPAPSKPATAPAATPAAPAAPAGARPPRPRVMVSKPTATPPAPSAPSDSSDKSEAPAPEAASTQPEQAS